jgi:hypothetical protein
MYWIIETVFAGLGMAVFMIGCVLLLFPRLVRWR